jgi:hypothetical protein
VSVRTSVRGRNAVSMTWRRGPVEVSDEVQALAHTRYRLFALLPALVGPELFYTRFTADPVTPQGGTAPIPPAGVPNEPEHGWVDYAIEPDLDTLDDTLPDLFRARGATLADLIEPRGTVPGLYWNLEQILRLQSGSLGTGGGYGNAGRPGGPGSPPGRGGRPPRGGIVFSDRCSRRRTVGVRVRVPRGDRLTRIRASVTGRRAKTFRAGKSLRRNKAVLRRMPKRRFRVRVKATLRSGWVFTSKSSFAGCRRR